MDSTRKTAYVEANIDGTWQPARLHLGAFLPNETRCQRIASFKQLQAADPNYKLEVHRRNHPPREIALKDIRLDPKGECTGEPSIPYDRLLRVSASNAEVKAETQTA